MRKICVINQKGGIGKTTTALNIAAGLSRFDRKVLLIDIDSQSNIELSIDLDNSRTVYDFLFEEVNYTECLNSMGKNLDMIKGDKDIIYTEQEILEKKNGEIDIKNRLSTIKGYDYVIFDCGPSMSAINRSALLYSSEVIIPTSADYLGYESLKKMLVTLKSFVDRSSHDLRISKIVPTLFDKRNKICKTILKKIQNEYYQYASNPINLNSKLKEAPMHKKSIFKYAPSSPGAKDYMALVKEILSDESKFNEKSVVLDEFVAAKTSKAKMKE
jgi:chromosome partitioning protein